MRVFSHILAIMVSIVLMSPQEISAEIGSRLKSRRLSLRMTQAELADRTGLSVGSVKNLEAKTATCTLDIVVRASLALGLVEHFEPLFVVRPKSIAQMEQIAEAPRQRARRKRGE